MKRALLLLVLFVCSMHLTHGQTLYGIKGGVNLAGVDFNSQGVYENRTAPYVGGFARLDLSQRFFLQPELLYNVKGTKYGYVVPNPSNPSGLSFMEEGTLGFQYVSLPLMAGYRPTTGLSVVLGPEIGYMASMKSSEETAGYYRVLKDSKKLDVGLNLGLSYAITTSIGIEARYNYGFNTLNEHDEIPNQEDPGRPYILNRPGGNRVIQFGLSYTFGK